MKRHAPLAIAASLPAAQAADFIPFGATWDYMHPTAGVDPAIADTNFNTTWYLSTFDFAANYNGPAFGEDAAIAGPPVDSGSGPAPFGYDVVSYIENTLGGVATMPADGLRGAAYLRHDFLTSTTDDLEEGSWGTIDTTAALTTSSTLVHDPGNFIANFYRASRRP